VVGEPFLGITYGPAIQVDGLIAAWCFASLVAMFAVSHTPLGRISKAVRDNPERAEFLGYHTQRVYVMGHGHIVFEGTPADPRANARIRKEWLEV
jgi:ABC-type branched-subunit amino acid transport system permease subunit